VTIAAQLDKQALRERVEGVDQEQDAHQSTAWLVPRRYL
jgi:hypothetical protein